MKKLLLLPLAAGLAMLAGTAFAQDAGTPPPPLPPAGAAMPGEMTPPPPAGGPEGRGPEARGPEGRGPEGRGPEGRGPDGPRGERHGRHGPRDDKGGPEENDGPTAAHFRIEQGDLRIDVKCAEGEPMQACADIASRLLREVRPAPRP